MRDAGVIQGFVNRFVSISVFGVFSDDGDADLMLWIP